jgi:hypothetical protein
MRSQGLIVISPANAFEQEQLGWEQALRGRLINSITQTGILAFDDAFGGDHRAMYFDLDVAKFFYATTSNPVSHQGRDFTTKDIKKTKLFTDSTMSEWERRNMSFRIQTLSEISKLPSHQVNIDKASALFEKLDAEITRVFETATSSLNTPPKRQKSWSPQWARAGAARRYWRARIRNVWAGRGDSIALIKLRHKYRFDDDGTDDLSLLSERYDSAVKLFREITKHDVDYH